MTRPGLHNLSVDKAMDLWAELVEAFHGVNGHGGNVAELYAYRFGHFSPSIDEDYGEDNAAVLGQLLDRFIEVFPARVSVDGDPHRLRDRPLPFTHRVHVKVEHL